MKKHLFVLLSFLSLSACNDDEIYTAKTSAVNLIAPDVDFIYHNSDSSNSLTELQGLGYAKSSPWNLLTQDDKDKTVYRFSAVDANSQETLIAQTALEFGSYEEVLLFAYGKLSGAEQQAAEIKGLALSFDDIAAEKFALYVVHAYPAELGELDVEITNYQDPVTLAEDGLEYGNATTRYTFNHDYNLVTVSQHKGNNTALIKKTLNFKPNAVNVVFITSTSHNSNQIELFNFSYEQP